MSKVRTFSTKFPAYHSKAGEQTFFIEKLWNSILNDKSYFYRQDSLLSYYKNFINNDYEPKHHTIRGGKHFKVGDFFSPRIWLGKPYRSKQIIVADDILIKKVWNFETTKSDFYLNGVELTYDQLKTIAKNDGLQIGDFEEWFNAPNFSGQIICWNKNINY